MKKLMLSIAIIMAMGMCGCAEKRIVQDTPKVTVKQEVEKVVEVPKVYKQGEEATMYDLSLIHI